MKNFLKKAIISVVLASIGLYFLCVTLSKLKYRQMDFNHDGVISPFEVFYALDVGERKVSIVNSDCIEYFSYKDGLTVDIECTPLPKADLVVVHKSLRALTLFKDGKVLKVYHIALGSHPKGHKRQEGDGKTPEGNYTLDYKKLDSAFYKAIHISYPNEADKDYAQKRGIEPGGLIMIHGQKNYLGWLSFITQRFDWTSGCIAVTNEDMDEIYKSVEIGTKIVIYP